MHLVRAIRQAQGALGHVHARQRGVLGYPQGAVHLDRLVDDTDGHVGHCGLDHGNPHPRFLGIDVIHHPGGFQGEQAGLFDVHAGLGDDIHVAPQPRQRLAEGNPRHRALAQQAQGFFRRADGAHAVVDAARAEASLGYLETAAGAEDDIVLRHPHIVEALVHMAVGRIVHGKHVHGPDIFKAGGVDGHQYLRLLQVLGSVGIGLHHHDHDLAAGVAGAGHIVLLAIDDPLVAVQHRAGTDIGGIRGGHPGLGHGVGGADLAVHQRLQPLLLLGLAAVFVQHLHIAGVGGGAVEHLRGNM